MGESRRLSERDVEAGVAAIRELQSKRLLPTGGLPVVLTEAMCRRLTRAVLSAGTEAREDEGFKYAGFSGPHPSLTVDCPTCGSPAGHYCNDDQGPVDGPHDERRTLAAGVGSGASGERSWTLGQKHHSSELAFVEAGPMLEPGERVTVVESHPTRSGVEVRREREAHSRTKAFFQRRCDHLRAINERLRQIPPMLGSCDWGGCDEPGVTFRFDPDDGWLPVCEAHREPLVEAHPTPDVEEVLGAVVSEFTHHGYARDGAYWEPGEPAVWLGSERVRDRIRARLANRGADSEVCS